MLFLHYINQDMYNINELFKHIIMNEKCYISCDIIYSVLKKEIYKFSNNLFYFTTSTYS